LVNGIPLLVLWDEFGCSVAEVNRVLDLFANATITDKVRKHTLALELARLDELQEAFYDRL
jgi:Tfp pilus assembly PilM family ATPase